MRKHLRRLGWMVSLAVLTVPSMAPTADSRSAQKTLIADSLQLTQIDSRQADKAIASWQAVVQLPELSIKLSSLTPRIDQQVKEADEVSGILLETEGVLDESDELLEGERQRTDLHSFYGQAGQMVLIKLRSSDFTPAVMLIDETAEAATDVIEGRNGLLSVTMQLPSSGIYVLVVTATEPTGEGIYSLHAEITNEREEADRLIQEGARQHLAGKPHNALQAFQQALNISQSINYRQGIANSMEGLGIVYESLGQYQEAISFSQQSLAIFRELKDRSNEAVSLGNIGVSYRSLSQYELARDFLRFCRNNYSKV